MLYRILYKVYDRGCWISTGDMQIKVPNALGTVDDAASIVRQSHGYPKQLGIVIMGFELLEGGGKN